MLTHRLYTVYIYHYAAIYCTYVVGGLGKTDNKTTVKHAREWKILRGT